jgi:hypothetical protein
VLIVVTALVSFLPTPAFAADPPAWLPRYELELNLDVARRRLTGVERVTFTNRHTRPAADLVFNAYSRYKIPDGDGVLLAKTLELLRSNPSDGIDWTGHRLDIQSVTFVKPDGTRQPLSFAWKAEPQTAFAVTLPTPIKQHESVTVEIHFTLDLPDKEGRWGHRQGITYMTHALPALTIYDDTGWHPTPFIAWHQPFHQEAGHYTVHLTLPSDQKLACTGSILAETDRGDGTKLVSIASTCAREFSFVCSARFHEWSSQVGTTRVRVLAIPEHAQMAQRCLDVACEVIPIYNKWFGQYPYPDFCIAESHFAWNGNECSGLVMIDSRVMGITPLMARYIDHLVSHETLHQWWYNVVGTDGYRETFMDEGIATFYTAKVLQKKWGKNAKMLQYPVGQSWLPNVKHDDYRFYGLYGTLARKEEAPTLQPIDQFGHVVTLFSMTYDKGSKIYNMIEERMGEDALLDFLRLVYTKYQFRILRVADFKRELETYTGRNWDEFFQNWVYGVGGSDWAIDSVKNEKTAGPGVRTTVVLNQKAEFTEPTTLGIRFDGKSGYDLHIPISPDEGVPSNAGVPVQWEMKPDRRTVTLTFDLPHEPKQIAVDPDGVLLDKNPANNLWKCEPAVRLTPLLNPLDQTDITTSHDRWNIMAGPWLGLNRPQFGQKAYAGFRADLYRLHTFQGGSYLAWDTDDLDLKAGADGIFHHWPWTKTELGIQYDHSMTDDWASLRRDRGRIYSRYILHDTPSFYLNPVEYVELYGRVEHATDGMNRGRFVPAGVESFNDQAGVGLRWYRNYLTPYWDPEGGYKIDFNFEHGLPMFGTYSWYERVQGEFVFVKSMPEAMSYLSETKLALRAYGGMGWPDNGFHYQLGGGNRIRGLPRSEREGDSLWVGTVEWRLPLWKQTEQEFLYRAAKLENLYAAVFYDVGEVYLNGKTNGGVIHSVGAGLRFDLGWLGFIERTTLRLDFAKAISQSESIQFWFGLQHAF